MNQKISRNEKQKTQTKTLIENNKRSHEYCPGG